MEKLLFLATPAVAVATICAVAGHDYKPAAVTFTSTLLLFLLMSLTDGRSKWGDFFLLAWIIGVIACGVWASGLVGVLQ